MPNPCQDEITITLQTSDFGSFPAVKMAQKCATKQNILTVNILDKHTKLTNTAEVFCCILCLFGGIIVCSSGKYGTYKQLL